MAALSRAQILELDVAERLELIEALWDSIAGDPEAAARLPLTAADRALLDERLREHREHPEDVRPWAEVRAELLARRR